MPISLHDAAVPTMQQMLAAAQGWLDKAEAGEHGEGAIAGDRLIEDMAPFGYQIKSMAVHSMGAIEGLRAGVFSPDRDDPPMTFAGMRARLQEAQDFLAALDPAELDGFIGKPMRFEFGDFVLPFTAENFLLSFSQPNFFFHATTAYNILRKRGLEIGKRDYMGPARIARPES